MEFVSCNLCIHRKCCYRIAQLMCISAKPDFHPVWTSKYHTVHSMQETDAATMAQNSGPPTLATNKTFTVPRNTIPLLPYASKHNYQTTSVLILPRKHLYPLHFTIQTLRQHSGTPYTRVSTQTISFFISTGDLSLGQG
jgi:hypothetical protein